MAPIASSSWPGTPSLRTRKTSSGASQRLGDLVARPARRRAAAPARARPAGRHTAAAGLPTGGRPRSGHGTIVGSCFLTFQSSDHSRAHSLAGNRRRAVGKIPAFSNRVPERKLVAATGGSEVNKIAALFRRLTYGVYVIGVADGDQRNAFTAAWVMQTSFDPLLLALSINPQNASYPLLHAGAGIYGQRPEAGSTGSRSSLRHPSGRGTRTSWPACAGAPDEPARPSCRMRWHTSTAGGRGNSGGRSRAGAWPGDRRTGTGPGCRAPGI